MTERDANQLAADGKQAVKRVRGEAWGVNNRARHEKDCDTLDELVGLVGTLQQERDEWKAEAERRGLPKDLMKQWHQDRAALAELRKEDDGVDK
jgi:hypothetical protein